MFCALHHAESRDCGTDEDKFGLSFRLFLRNGSTCITCTCISCIIRIRSVIAAFEVSLGDGKFLLIEETVAGDNNYIGILRSADKVDTLLGIKRACLTEHTLKIREAAVEIYLLSGDGGYKLIKAGFAGFLTAGTPFPREAHET